MPQAPGTQFYKAQSHIGSRDKNVAYYYTTLSDISEEAIELLQTYSQIKPTEIESHVLSIRDKAWEIFPYPCIGQFKFLMLTLCGLPAYPDILQRLKNGDRYLDVGCCMGQDLRKLVMDGAPPDNLHGVDFHADFLPLSYDLFQDKATLKSHLGKGDILNIDAEDSVVCQMRGTVDILHLGMVVHVFNKEDQRRMLHNCVALLKPASNSIIIGTAVGDMEGAQGPAGNYMNSDGTFQALCADVAKELGVSLDCKASLDFGLQVQNANQNPAANRVRRLVFVVQLK